MRAVVTSDPGSGDRTVLRWHRGPRDARVAPHAPAALHPVGAADRMLLCMSMRRATEAHTMFLDEIRTLAEGRFADAPATRAAIAAFMARVVRR